MSPPAHHDEGHSGNQVSRARLRLYRAQAALPAHYRHVPLPRHVRPVAHRAPASAGQHNCPLPPHWMLPPLLLLLLLPAPLLPLLLLLPDDGQGNALQP
jgi:hypothetical protein